MSTHKWTIVSGGLGVGKTTLVREGADRIFYGRFSPLSRSHNGPSYRAFRGALEEYVKHVVADKSGVFHSDLDAADIREITDLFPFLVDLFEETTKPSFSPDPSCQNGPGTVALTSLYQLPDESMYHDGLSELFVKLFKAFHEDQGRFVLEDWHWADKQSLEILDALFTHRKGIKIPIVCTCRDDLTDGSSADWQDLKLKMLRETQDDQTTQEVQLFNWKEADLNRWLEGSYKISDHLSGLSKLVMGRTKGNPLFSYYFVHMLIEEEMIKYPGSDDSELNADALFSPNFATSLPDSLVECIHRITMRRQETWSSLTSIATAICEEGNEDFHPQLLAVMTDQSSQTIENNLNALPYVFERTQEGTVRFKHNEVRKSILALMSEDKRVLTHYQNGSRLWNHFGQIIESNNNMLFLTVNELQRGSVHITDDTVKLAFAKLSLKAGEMAMRSAQFRQARSYFEAAIGCLGWTKQNYDAMLTLHNFAAEASYAAGDFLQMDTHLETVFGHSRSFSDSLRARCTQMFANGARCRPNATDDALDLLKRLGADLPSNPSQLLVFREFVKTRWLLRNKTDIDFLRLPVATDQEAVALMQVLSFTFTTFYASNPKLALLVTFRLLHMIFEYGVTGPAIVAISTYSFLLCASFGWINEAYRLGKIAFQMGRAYSARPYLPRICIGFYGYVAVWVEPYRALFVPLRETYRLAMQTGDMESATFGCSVLVTLYLDSGRRLDDVEKETRCFCQAMDRLNQTVGLSITMTIYSFIVCDLLGRAMPSLDLGGPVQDGKTARYVAQGSGSSLSAGYVEFIHLSLQAMLLCLQGKHVACVEVAAQGHSRFRETNAPLLFFESVSSLIASRSRTGLVRLQLRRLGWSCCRMFGRWATRCPANFRGKYFLQRAELCACNGCWIQAIKWYEKSIAWSAKENLLVDEGLANACLGNFFREIGCRQLALPFFSKAKESYQQWGAVTLVVHIDAIIDQIYSEEPIPPSTAVELPGA